VGTSSSSRPPARHQAPFTRSRLSEILTPAAGAADHIIATAASWPIAEYPAGAPACCCSAAVQRVRRGLAIHQGSQSPDRPRDGSVARHSFRGTACDGRPSSHPPTVTEGWAPASPPPTTPWPVPWPIRRSHMPAERSAHSATSMTPHTAPSSPVYEQIHWPRRRPWRGFGTSGRRSSMQPLGRAITPNHLQSCPRPRHGIHAQLRSARCSASSFHCAAAEGIHHELQASLPATGPRKPSQPSAPSCAGQHAISPPGQPGRSQPQTPVVSPPSRWQRVGCRGRGGKGKLHPLPDQQKSPPRQRRAVKVAGAISVPVKSQAHDI